MFRGSLTQAEDALNLGDFESARRLLRPLVEKDHPAAVRLNASFFDAGLSEEEMDRIYTAGVQRAADLGDVQARYLVGVWYDLGDFGFEVDKRRASFIFKELAGEGDPHCMWIHACDLLWGRGCFEQNEQEGLRFLDSALSAGSLEAAMTKAQLFGDGLLGISIDTEKRDLFRARAKELAGEDYVYDPYETSTDT